MCLCVCVYVYVCMYVYVNIFCLQGVPEKKYLKLYIELNNDYKVIDAYNYACCIFICFNNFIALRILICSTAVGQISIRNGLEKDNFKKFIQADTS